MPFTDDVTDVILSAVQEARRLHHTYLGTEHLLFGLAEAAPQPLRDILSELGATTDAIDEQIKDIIGAGTTVLGTMVDSPTVLQPSLRAQRVMVMAGEQAERLGVAHVDSGCVILAICMQLGVANQVLVQLGVSDFDIVEKIFHAAGKTDEQVDEWMVAYERYQDAVLFKQMSNIVDIYSRLKTTLPEGIDW